MPGFVATTTGNFLPAYVQELRETGESASRIAVWLLKNATYFSPDDFYDPSFDWSQLTPLQVLMLRAVVGDTAFTESARDGYRSRVMGIPELERLTSVLFAPGDLFLGELPREYETARAILGTIQSWASDNRR